MNEYHRHIVLITNGLYETIHIKEYSINAHRNKNSNKDLAYYKSSAVEFRRWKL